MFDVKERINELITLRGWSQFELANQASISTNAVYDWFKIDAMPTIQNIIKICDATDITLEQFFCRGSYKYSQEENAILEEWHALSDLEKSSIMNLIDTFKILKNN